MKIALLAILCAAMSLAACTQLPVLSLAPIYNNLDIPDADDGSIIPGLKQGAIPQGLAYDDHSSLLIMTHYFTGDSPSCVSILETSGSGLMGIKWLSDSDGTHVRGHVGGVAIGRHHVWIASSGSVYKYRKDDVLHKNGTNDIIAINDYSMETRASYCTYYDDLLFVGEFANYSFPNTSRTRHPTHSTHHIKDRHDRKKYAWICAYDPDGDLKTPVRILSVRQKVQDVAMTDDYIFLSISYGRKNGSKLAIYRNPFKETPHRHVISKSGKQVPLWFLDESSWLRTVNLPPMSQGIEVIEGRLAVLYESGAEKYRKDTSSPIDRILYYDLNQWTEQEQPD